MSTSWTSITSRLIFVWITSYRTIFTFICIIKYKSSARTSSALSITCMWNIPRGTIYAWCSIDIWLCSRRAFSTWSRMRCWWISSIWTYCAFWRSFFWICSSWAIITSSFIYIWICSCWTISTWRCSSRWISSIWAGCTFWISPFWICSS